jgi:hypothetical protein
MAILRRCIDVAHRCLARQGGHGLIMGHEGLRGPIDHLLDGSRAYGQMQERVAEVLHETPRGAVQAAEFAYERCQAWAVASGVRGMSALRSAPQPTP